MIHPAGGYFETMNIHRVLQSVESVEALDGPADAGAAVASRLVGGDRVAPLLRGSWLGHPVHPLLVMLPLGAWMSSLVFDVGFGDRTTARRLVGLGLLATPPTVVAGWADFPLLTKRQRRVGVVHAASNVVGVTCFALSYRARRREHHRTATWLSVLGLLAVSVGGALGGHLSYAQGAGMYRWQTGRALTHLRAVERYRSAA
ncbi:membrane protein [Mycolicibacterium agri]|uniref:Membrane protein n=2 Tax=Mycolicibacterium agri TaxID=36811 RepID=A0A7I9W6N7_MYCAG|nr:membrane protein [Mycolicibacterium agri]